jgi:hypothetical protein
MARQPLGCVIAIIHQDNAKNELTCFSLTGGGGDDHARVQFFKVRNFNPIPFDRVLLKYFALGGHDGFGGSVVLLHWFHSQDHTYL